MNVEEINELDDLPLDETLDAIQNDLQGDLDSAVILEGGYPEYQYTITIDDVKDELRSYRSVDPGDSFESARNIAPIFRNPR